MTESPHPRIRKVMVVILLGIFLAECGNGIWDLLFSNYLSDVHGMDAGQRGMMEFPRELPGILCFVAISALFFLNEVKLSALACLLAAAGAVGILTLSPQCSIITLSLWVVTASLGQHILIGTIDSIVMHTARPENRSLRLGQMRALCTAAALLGALYVWVKWKFNSSYAVDYTVMACILTLAAALFFTVRHGAQFPPRRSWRENFILRREYAVYYGLETLHGIRKQLFLTFGYWLMVSTLGQSPGRIGMVMLIAGVIGLFTQPLIGWSIKRFGERRVTIFDSVALAALCLAYAFAPDVLPVTWAVGVVGGCFVLDKLLFAMGMARTTYITRICGERKAEITPCIYTGIAINHVASISYGIIGGIIWQTTGGPQAVFLIGGIAVVAAGFLATRMK
ncbi:MAG: hypothetical protein Q4F30_02170 [Akkermansia sp.]|nr:hypothetical protein [Akkermansia sp.]